MIDQAFVSRLRQALDRDAALALLRRAVGTPSVTGNEKAFAELLAGELQALGAADVRLRDFAPGRPNVSGLLKGAGGGPVLLLAGHTDTVHVKGWTERWAGTARQDPFGGAVVDGAIWGRGTGDLKAGICRHAGGRPPAATSSASSRLATCSSPSSATRRAARRGRASAPA